MESNSWKIDVNVPMVVLFAALTGIGLLLTVVAVDAWYKNTESEIIAEKWDKNPDTWRTGLKSEQLANVNGNRRIDRYHRHVPVTEAMRILAQNNGKVPE
ncbi:MAG TPA: hypothetical protein VIM11_11720 [Tepidisphaeraceae bacterium]|jgi:hypothetical protein